MSHDPYPLPNDPHWGGPHPAEVLLVEDVDGRVEPVVCLSREVNLDERSRPVVTVQLKARDRHEFVSAPLVGFGLTWKTRIEEFVYGA